ncbi:MAG: hypothetical protein FJX67_00940 [Alphaproteobacteria bacterium]|nr:hypothetical protein [Alphaproteobacteria bacterium]
MNPTRLLRSSTTRLGLVYVALFALSVLLLTVIVYWLASTFIVRRAAQYEHRGLPGLRATIEIPA